MMARATTPLLFILIPASTLAAQADTTRQTRDSLERVRRLAPVIVSASREPLQQNRLGVSASVLTATDLKAEPAFSAAEVASRFAGVYMDANAGPGGPTNVRLRGGDDAFTKVLMDGIEVNVSGGPFRFQGMTTGNVDRVELVRGPQSALHGSNAMTGVLQYFTTTGQPGKPRWSFETVGGSSTGRGGHGGANGSVSGGTDAVRYSAGAGFGFDEGIYDVKHNLQSREGSTRLDYDPAGPLMLTGTVRYNHMRSNLPVRNPGTTRVPLDPNQRDENNLLMTGLTATLTPSTAWLHQLRVAVFHNNFTYEDRADQVPAHPNIPYSNGNTYSNSDLVRSTIGYDATRRFTGANKSAAWTAGALVEREATSDSAGTDLRRTPQERNHTSLFSELNATLGSVSVLGGGRFEWYDGLGWAVVPRASVSAEIVPSRFSLRAAAGRGFKAANIQQQFLANAFIIPNPDLKPETSWSAELGAHFTAENGVQLSATYFQQWFYGLIRVVPAPAPETRLVSKNLGRTDANGVELEASGMLPRGVFASANVSWIHTSIVDNSGQAPTQFPVDSALPSRPVIVGGGTLDIPMGRLHGVVRASVVGRNLVLTEIFSGSRTTLDPYTLLGVTLTYDVTLGLSFYTRGDNLFNTYYSAGYDRRGMPRTVRVGLRMSN